MILSVRMLCLQLTKGLSELIFNNEDPHHPTQEKKRGRRSSHTSLAPGLASSAVSHLTGTRPGKSRLTPHWNQARLSLLPHTSLASRLAFSAVSHLTGTTPGFLCHLTPRWHTLKQVLRGRKSGSRFLQAKVPISTAGVGKNSGA